MPSGQDVAAGTLQQDRLEPGRMGVITVDHLRKTYRVWWPLALFDRPLGAARTPGVIAEGGGELE